MMHLEIVFACHFLQVGHKLTLIVEFKKEESFLYSLDLEVNVAVRDGITSKPLSGFVVNDNGKKYTVPGDIGYFLFKSSNIPEVYGRKPGYLVAHDYVSVRSNVRETAVTLNATEITVHYEKKF